MTFSTEAFIKVREVTNYRAQGDCRGEEWLRTHPDAAVAAQERVARFAEERQAAERAEAATRLAQAFEAHRNQIFGTELQ